MNKQTPLLSLLLTPLVTSSLQASDLQVEMIDLQKLPEMPVIDFQTMQAMMNEFWDGSYEAAIAKDNLR